MVGHEGARAPWPTPPTTCRFGSSDRFRRISDIKKDVSGIRRDMGDVNQKVDGLAIMFAMLAGHVPHLEERIETRETGG